MNRGLVLILLFAAGCHQGTKILQRRTMANMSTVAAALEAYAGDAGQYPSVSTPKELVNELVPRYMARDERSDEGYTDGKFDSGSLRDLNERPLNNAEEDIVYRDGKFIRYPSAE